MRPADFATAFELIRAARGKPVRLYLRRRPGTWDEVEVTTQIPTGAFEGSYVRVGLLDVTITIGELVDDLVFAEQSLSRQLTRERKREARATV